LNPVDVFFKYALLTYSLVLCLDFFSKSVLLQIMWFYEFHPHFMISGIFTSLIWCGRFFYKIKTKRGDMADKQEKEDQNNHQSLGISNKIIGIK
jgi:hypothetical protein